jgi:hypothetical protein
MALLGAPHAVHARLHAGHADGHSGERAGVPSLPPRLADHACAGLPADLSGEEGKVQEAEKFSKEVYSYIDSACSKGIIHKNTASRKIGRLASSLYKAKVTVPSVEKSKEVVKVEEKPVVEVATEKVEEKKETKKTTAKKTTKKADEKTEKPVKKTTRTKKAE